MTPSLETRVRELATLNAIADVLNREPDFTQALSTALVRLVELVDLSAGWVFLTNVEEGDSHRGSFRLAAATGLPPALEQDNRAPLCGGSCECQWLLQEGGLDAGVNMVTCSRLEGATGERDGLEVHASIPLLTRQGAVGIVNLAAPGTAEFDAETLQFLTTVGKQLGTAFERSKLQEARTREAKLLATLEERQRLAREMHDSVAQSLFAADLSVRVAQESKDAAQRQQALVRTGKLIQGALDELRGLVEVMRPADLSGGLKGALARLARRTAGTLRVQLEANNTSLSDLHAEALYRVAQEALHNTLRHAGAENVWLELTQTTETITLKVRDDGQGFDMDEVTKGFGLASMSERVRAVGGIFSLHTHPGEGTEIEVKLPWHAL